MQPRDNRVVYYLYSVADFVYGLYIEQIEYSSLNNGNQYPNPQPFPSSQTGSMFELCLV